MKLCSATADSQIRPLFYHERCGVFALGAGACFTLAHRMFSREKAVEAWCSSCL